jgi:predicted RNA binding protein YcfA (HicA-like mRNA interferase family)
VSAVTKLVRRFLDEPNTIEVDDVRRLLNAFGYRETRKGSEYIFHKKGAYPITVPTVKGRHVKSPYVKRLSRLLLLEEWYERNKEE